MPCSCSPSYLVRTAVAAPVIRRGVVPQAVGHGLHQDGLILRKAELPRLSRGGVHGESVVSVHPNAVHAVARGTRNYAVPAILVLHRRAARNNQSTHDTWTARTMFGSRGDLNTWWYLHDFPTFPTVFSATKDAWGAKSRDASRSMILQRTKFWRLDLSRSRRKQPTEPRHRSVNVGTEGQRDNMRGCRSCDRAEQRYVKPRTEVGRRAWPLISSG